MTEVLDDAARYLDAPLHVRGSGRVRYGAAMALYGAGQISAEVLEVFRTASPHDGRDVGDMLRERGLVVPELGGRFAPENTPLHRLYAEARAYLLGLNHAGAAEVRAGLPFRLGKLTPPAPQQNPCAAQLLAPALDALRQTHGALAGAIDAAAPHLAWITYDAYPRDLIGEAFAQRHAFASLMGADAPFAAQDFDFGLFLIAPNTLYRDHSHAAPELYAPLTGPHGWRFGVGRPLITKPAHHPIWNPPHRPHLTKTGAVPFLALFVWTKDTASPAAVVPAPDWPQLEVQRIA